jgi:DNA-binding response OmpR family regulator
MSKAKLLLVEDDPGLGTILQETLTMQGFDVDLREDGRQGQVAFLSNPYDLCLIDVMLPKLDGFSLVQHIRQIDTHVPILFLTAKSMKADRIKGFTLGADDYITKPFSIEELVLRIRAVLKRTGTGAILHEPRRLYSFASFQLDRNRNLLRRGDSEQKLTFRESELLALLCENCNHIVEREKALRLIWQDDSFFAGRSMDVYISKLRKRLKSDPSVEIVNIYRIGFKLIVRD